MRFIIHVCGTLLKRQYWEKLCSSQFRDTCVGMCDDGSLSHLGRFWLRVIDSGIVSPVAQRRFIDYFAAYTEAVINEAADRDAGRRASVDRWMLTIRSGGIPSVSDPSTRSRS